jgi:hypothetical protein
VNDVFALLMKKKTNRILFLMKKIFTVDDDRFFDRGRER